MRIRARRLAAAAIAAGALVLGATAPSVGRAASEAARPPVAAWVRLDTALALNPLGERDTIRVTPLGAGAHSSAVLIQLAPGARVPGHVHRAHDETVWVVRGEARMRFGSEVRLLAPGDLVSVPQGTPHGAVAGPGGCVVVSVYAPLWDAADRHRDPSGDP